LGKVQPANQTEQTAFARAVVADQTNAGLGQCKREVLKHHRIAALQGDVVKADAWRVDGRSGGGCGVHGGFVNSLNYQTPVYLRIYA
jgi:hypothetical protein